MKENNEKFRRVIVSKFLDKLGNVEMKDADILPALETFFPEFKCRGLYVKGADLVKELKDSQEAHEEELRRKHGLISLSELDEIMKELHRHMDEALPEFYCRKPCPKKEEKK